jgi:hypothetical protein
MKRWRLSASDFRELQRSTAGPITLRLPADSGRVRLSIPDGPRSRRQRRNR